MAPASKFIRIELTGEYYVKGLYLVNDGKFDGYSVIDNTLKKDVKPPFKLMLRAYITLDGKYVERKKTFTFTAPTTFINAVNHIRNTKDHFKVDAAIPKPLEPSPAEVEALQKAENRLSVTLGEYWENDYCIHKITTVRAKEQWRPSTEKDMKSFYNTWIKTSPMHNMKVVAIKDTHIEALISVVKSQRSLRTAKKVTEALSPLFKRFYKHNKINELNPADIDLGDLNNVREVMVTLIETKRLYDAMFNYPIDKYRHIFIFLATGRRLNEVLSLRIQDIDLAKSMFDIHQDNSKSGKKLSFVLRPEMYDALKNKTDLIHPSDKNTTMDGSTIRNHWEKVKINAGLITGYDEKKKPITYDLHIHDIRHIIATELRNSGVTEEVSALVLGHTRSSITARYASANAQLANDVYQFFLDKINGIIEQTAKWVDA